MKFLCDRCKTRYSIGDERVRGKILKIRCKNCANVITVREGMAADPDASPDYAARAKKSTTMAPAAHDERGDAAKDRGAGPATEPLGPAKQPAAARQPGAETRQPLGAAKSKQGAATEPLGPAKQPLGAAKSKQGAATEPLGPAKQPLGAAKSKQGAATEPLGPVKSKQGAATESLGPAKPSAGAARDAAGLAKESPAAANQPGAAKDRPAAAGGGQARRAQPEEPARGLAKRPAAQEFLRGEPVNALGAAFASAMAKPPPALEEEWYVSIDGEQAGPFSLTDAQHWVAQRPFDAELHCWSEGFDDWLPVDKVSHFRGLRKRPAPQTPAAPPPTPRAPPRAAAPARAELEDEPKPLFAATMASLERGAPPVPSTGLQLPPARSSARATPGFGTAVPPRTNGAALAPGAAAAAQHARPDGKPDGKPEGKPDGKPEGKPDGKPEGKPESKFDGKPAAARPGAPLGPVYGQMGQLIDDPFELGELGEMGDAETQIEQAPFSDEPAGVMAPAASSPARPSAPPSSSDAALTSPHLPASTTLHGTGANPAMTVAAVAAASADMGFRDDEDDSDLAIGEVSRVVNLADIARPARDTERPAPARRLATSSGPIGRTGVNPRLRSTGALPNMAGAGLVGPAPTDAAALAIAPVAKSHRRGLIALLGVAIVVVLLVGGAVFLFVTDDDGPTGGSLGPVHDIDTSRPDLPTTHRPNPVGSGATANPATPNPFVPRTVHPRTTTGPAGGNHDVDVGPAGDALRSDEIEDVARKNQDMTQRCYMRSQRGADSILVGDVKKIGVTLVIDKDGRVNDVQLSDHAADNLGKCLSGSIRSWRFRQSSGGTFKFSLNFVSG